MAVGEISTSALPAASNDLVWVRAWTRYCFDWYNPSIVTPSWGCWPWLRESGRFPVARREAMVFKRINTLILTTKLVGALVQHINCRLVEMVELHPSVDLPIRLAQRQRERDVEKAKLK